MRSTTRPTTANSTPETRHSRDLEQRLRGAFQSWPRQPVERGGLFHTREGPGDSEDDHDARRDECVRKHGGAPRRHQHDVGGQEHERRDGLQGEDQGERETVERPGAARVAFHRPQQEQGRQDSRRKHQGVRPRLLRPPDDERTRCEQQPTHDGDPALDDPVREHHEQGRGHHGRDDGRQPKRPLRCSGDEHPWLEQQVVEPVVLVERVEEVVANGPHRERLVDPQRCGRQSDQPEHERDPADESDVDDELARSRSSKRAERDARDRLCRAHRGLTRTNSGCSPGSRSAAPARGRHAAPERIASMQHAGCRGRRTAPIAWFPPSRRPGQRPIAGRCAGWRAC